jgi:hypothetical protein
MRVFDSTDRLGQNTSPKRKRGIGDDFPSLALRASVFLTLACWLTAMELRADEGAKAAGESVQSVLDGVAKMGAAEQQAWLKALEERAIKAAGRTLKPADAAKEQARIRELLHEKVVTWQVLRVVLAETQAREAKLASPATPVPASPKPATPTKPRPDNKVKPRASVQPPERVNRPAAVKSDQDTKAKKAATLPAAERIEVNIEELDARIAGSNLGFRTLENDLDEKGNWDAARLEPLAERLKVLVVRHGDLALFRDLLSAEKRSSVARLEGPRSAISELGARISEARKAAQGEDFTGTETQRRAELERLEALSRRLADLEAK